MSKYADIILPLPLEGMFTYSIPDGMGGKVRRGVRVAVPFGGKKICVGMVAEVHDNAPEGFEVKPIAEVLGDTPVLLDSQYDLWRWISDYYMSPIGEVYNAALPAGLKAQDGYRPKTEVYVRLKPEFRTEQSLHVALTMLQRAAKQRGLLECYLHLSHYDSIRGNRCAEPVKEITREELLNEAHATTAVFNALAARGIFEVYAVEVGRLNGDGMEDFGKIKPLSAAQQTAYNGVLFSFLKHNVTLLHGVTSSGKTEIYIHLIKRELEQHRQVLYLLPEIALTVQITDRLKKVFGNRIGIYHSRYSDAERVEIWKKQLSDSPYDIILGARSAVFLPFYRLGLVIVDEEHEQSFKQQDPAPRYHARSVAVVMAQRAGAKTLLGTATPCIETYHNAVQGKYGLVELFTRYKDIELPEITVVDIKDLTRRKMMSGPFSPQLLGLVRDALARGEQAILFQNRRGFAPMIECRQCGWVPKCKNCDVSLTLHKNTGQLTCHYCGYTYRVPQACPCCEGKDLRGRGYGTEKIEDAVAGLFPEARVARMDLDTTRTRNAYERMIADFSAGRTNILIGTQMISKGLDFDRVSVVGILNADSMLNYPDFRAYEQAFMMMAQVSGRAGRKGRRGMVVLQTKNPQLPVVRQVVNNDYQAMYRDIVEERQYFKYPPFHRLIYVYMKHQKDAEVETAAIEMGSRLRQLFGERVLGPDKPSVAKVKNMSIRKIVIKLELGIDMKRVRQCLRTTLAQLMLDKRYKKLQVYFDVDPQ